MAPILEVRKLNHIYSQGTPFQHTALEDISFSMERGEFVGLIGHTGSGKSTLIQHLNGLLKPTSGEVLLDGKSIWESKEATRASRFRVGLVFQYPEYQLFEETVYKDIAFGPKNMKLDEKEIHRRVLEAADFVGLPESVLESSPFDLSGGQKRRVAIAGVIAMEPEILILDEPTAGLDPQGREEILENICRYRKEKKASIIMVSHSMSDVARMSDRILVMNKAHLVFDEAPKEVFQHAWELQEMGLDIPAVTRIFMQLKEWGMDVEPVYTMEQAVNALKEIRGGKRHA